MKVLNLFVIALIGMSASTRVDAEEDPYLIISVGTKSCGTFIKSEPPTKELYPGWAIGYISGANTRSSGPQRLVGDKWERNASLVLLENYCTRDPLAAFYMAVEALRDELAKKQDISTRK
jgi:hypothetical protein